MPGKTIHVIRLTHRKRGNLALVTRGVEEEGSSHEVRRPPRRGPDGERDRKVSRGGESRRWASGGPCRNRLRRGTAPPLEGSVRRETGAGVRCERSRRMDRT